MDIIQGKKNYIIISVRHIVFVFFNKFKKIKIIKWFYSLESTWTKYLHIYIFMKNNKYTLCFLKFTHWFSSKSFERMRNYINENEIPVLM